MGSFNGHAIPGSFFIIGGLWWLLHVVLEYASSLKEQGKNRGQSSNQNQGSWRRLPSKRFKNIPLEPLLKIVAAVMGTCVELHGINFRMLDKNNDFVKPDKYAHTTMYAFFGFSGLIEILNLCKVTQFSREAEYTILALAFGIEGTLFAFHLHGRDMFDVRIHTLLYIVIYLAALVILLEACLPKFRRELFMARCVLTLTQGSWFWEIAYTIYGKNKWFVEAEKDLTEIQLMNETEVITFAVMWHLLGWSLLLLFFCIATSCLYRRGKLSTCCFNSGKAQQSSSLLNGKLLTENNDVLLSDSEEETLLKRETGATNNPSLEIKINNIDEASY